MGLVRSVGDRFRSPITLVALAIRGGLCNLSALTAVCTHHRSVTTSQQSLDSTQLQSRKQRPITREAPAVTRFAPSPTGRLHLGSLRTALYNYLIAHATGGRFILRIEDTDRRRTVPGAEENIYSSLKWAGLSWHEGPDIGGANGPYRQSERIAIYSEWVQKMIGSGMAYKCYCDLPEMMTTSYSWDGPAPQAPGCIGACSSIPDDDGAPSGRPFNVRFRWDSDWQQIAAARGDIRTLTHGGPGQDFVLIKRDGFPTYHFANVVDDHLMGVTHVVRGMEWSISTRKHLALYHALGCKAPKFSHLGLLTKSDGSKLSKREQATTVDTYRRLGILPSAMRAWLAEHGGRINPMTSSESVRTIIELEDLVRRFHYGDFTTGPIQPNYAALDGIQLAHAVKAIESGDVGPLVANIVPELLNRVLAIDLLRRGHPSIDAEFLATLFPDEPGDSAVSVRVLPSSFGELTPMVSALAHAEYPLSPASLSQLEQAREYGLRVVMASPRPGTNVVVQLPWAFWRPPREQYVVAYDRMPVAGVDGEDAGPNSANKASKVEAKARVLRPLCAVFLTLLRGRLEGISVESWDTRNIDAMLRHLESDICDGKAAGLEAWSAQRLAMPHERAARWAGMGVVHMGIRFALHGAWDRAGMGSTPSLQLLGRDEALARLETVARVVKEIDGDKRKMQDGS